MGPKLLLFLVALSALACVGKCEDYEHLFTSTENLMTLFEGFKSIAAILHGYAQENEDGPAEFAKWALTTDVVSVYWASWNYSFLKDSYRNMKKFLKYRKRAAESSSAILWMLTRSFACSLRIWKSNFLSWPRKRTWSNSFLLVSFLNIK